jgi:two-component system cell cycle response regulator
MMSNHDSTTKGKIRILVVDDNPANLRLLSIMLSDGGYIVHAANDGKSALRFLQNLLPDLIMLDARMPGMDGFQVCRALKADTRTCDIPVVFVSASTDHADRMHAFESGAIDYIPKPLDEEDMLSCIKNHLRK